MRALLMCLLMRLCMASEDNNQSLGHLNQFYKGRANQYYGKRH